MDDEGNQLGLLLAWSLGNGLGLGLWLELLPWYSLPLQCTAKLRGTDPQRPAQHHHTQASKAEANGDKSLMVYILGKCCIPLAFNAKGKGLLAVHYFTASATHYKLEKARNISCGIPKCAKKYEWPLTVSRQGASCPVAGLALSLLGLADWLALAALGEALGLVGLGEWLGLRDSLPLGMALLPGHCSTSQQPAMAWAMSIGMAGQWMGCRQTGRRALAAWAGLPANGQTPHIPIHNPSLGSAA